MRILFICDSGFDYAQDLLYAGLVKMLGQQCVVDVPWNAKYHLPLKEYPKNLGHTSFTFPLFQNTRDTDLVILGSAKPGALQTYIKLLPSIKNKPVIFIDGGDEAPIGGDFYRMNAGKAYEAAIQQKPFDLIFKREYSAVLHEHHGNVYPLPFSFPYNVAIPPVPPEQKKYEVSFWGQQKPQVRENALRLLQGKYDCEQNGTTLHQNFYNYKRRGKLYLEELAACKIVLNFRGGGWDTMRYWETPAAGTFMISQQPQIAIPQNFVDGKHVAWCADDLSDLIEKIDYYLHHSTERENMAAAARAHLEKYHLNTCRAAFVLALVKEKVGIS